jgi:hypothetical protein
LLLLSQLLVLLHSVTGATPTSGYQQRVLYSLLYAWIACTVSLRGGSLLLLALLRHQRVYKPLHHGPALRQQLRTAAARATQHLRHPTASGRPAPGADANSDI